MLVGSFLYSLSSLRGGDRGIRDPGLFRCVGFAHHR